MRHRKIIVPRRAYYNYILFGLHDSPKTQLPRPSSNIFPFDLHSFSLAAKFQAFAILSRCSSIVFAPYAPLNYFQREIVDNVSCSVYGMKGANGAQYALGCLGELTRVSIANSITPAFESNEQPKRYDTNSYFNKINYQGRFFSAQSIASVGSRERSTNGSDAAQKAKCRS